MKLNNAELDWDFVKYRDNVSIDFNKKKNRLITENPDYLVHLHVKQISNYFDRDFNISIQAINDMDQELVNEFIPGLNPKFASEIIFTIESYNNGKVELGLTTGVMVKALQKGYEDSNQNPIIQQGLTITSDNKIVLGIRAKPSFRKNLPDEPNDYKIMLCPAGFATFNKNIDLKKSFYKELIEELGIIKNDVTNLEMFGQYKDTGFANGKRIIYTVHLNITFDRVVERWKNASHGWEYLDLINIDYNSDSIYNFLTTTDYSRHHRRARGLFVPAIKPVFEYLIKNPEFLESKFF